MAEPFVPLAPFMAWPSDTALGGAASMRIAELLPPNPRKLQSDCCRSFSRALLTEVGHNAPSLLVLRPWKWHFWDLDLLVTFDLLVDLLKPGCWKNHAFLEHHDCFDDGEYTACPFQMSVASVKKWLPNSLNIRLPEVRLQRS